MKHYLYILPFTNGKYFKFGISSNNYGRIKKHHSTYNGIKLDESIVYYSSKNNIRRIENIIRNDIDKLRHNPYTGMDGCTEVRKMSQLRETMELIERRVEKFGLRSLRVKRSDIINSNVVIRKSDQKINATYNRNKLVILYKKLIDIKPYMIKVEGDDEYYLISYKMEKAIEVAKDINGEYRKGSITSFERFGYFNRLITSTRVDKINNILYIRICKNIIEMGEMRGYVESKLSILYEYNATYKKYLNKYIQIEPKKNFMDWIKTHNK